MGLNLGSVSVNTLGHRHAFCLLPGTSVHARWVVYIQSRAVEDYLRYRRNLMTAVRSKSEGQFLRVATNLAIGVVGLVIIRLIVAGLPMFQEAGWIVKDKLTVVAGAVIAVDALLLSVLVRFAIELRAYLLGRFAELPGLGTMAASLVFLLTAAIAYTDFKPVTRAWPATRQLYLWSFFCLAAILLIQIVVLLYRDRDSMAARVLGQPMPASQSD